MDIIVNGEKKTVPEGYTAEKLVEAMALAGRRIAMEVNEEIVPRSTYAHHTFQPGDAIEIVHAVGGG
ncbi:MAG: sulfur carrier protein ThiS [Thioalkalispiraceae bacterium]|jgi:sulfur carrier protein